MRGFATDGQRAQSPRVTQKARAVPLAVDSIDLQLSRLEELAGKLLYRIHPLTTPSATGANELSSPKGMCEFASVLDGKADRIRAVADQIDLTLVSLEF